MKKKIFFIIGTRPEAIKVAPVIMEALKNKDKIETIIVSTGQHKEMLQQVLNLFNLKPDIELNLMKENQTLSSLTADLFKSLDEITTKYQPEWIVAQGDTTTVMVSSLIAYYHKIKFAHIEAGLRTGDLYHPYPEELNRRIADITADLLFAPTIRNKANLLIEKVDKEKILVVGNTVIDALKIIEKLPFNWNKSKLSTIPQDKKLILVTAHRRESFGIEFKNILEAIKELALTYSDIHFVFPVHLNPNVRKPVNEILSNINNISLIEPLDYQPMVNIIAKASLILTDSGGIQEEAPTFGTPLLVMRNETERQEGIESKVAKLVGTNKDLIIKESKKIIVNNIAKHNIKNPYGDGKSSYKIIKSIINHG